MIRAKSKSILISDKRTNGLGSFLFWVIYSSSAIPLIDAARPYESLNESKLVTDPTHVHGQACMDAVKGLKTYELCIASGGLNPSKEGDQDHYHEKAWLNFHTKPAGMKCKYCEATGYWPDDKGDLIAEKSMMIFCEMQQEMNMFEPKLARHCIETGFALSQDAVLYRGGAKEAATVFVLKTYFKDNPSRVPPVNFMADWQTKLSTGVMDAPLEGQEFGTVFFNPDGMKNDQMFLFDKAFDVAHFCLRLCVINGRDPENRFCVRAGGGNNRDDCSSTCRVCPGFFKSKSCCPK